MADSKNKFPKGAKEVEIRNFSSNKFDNIVVFASYFSDGIIPDYVIYYLKELKKNFDGIIFIADNPVFDTEITKIKDLVIYAKFSRHNEYDFGSYKRGYFYAKKAGIIKHAKSLLLANDSCFGPVFELKPILKKMNDSGCDFWGLVANTDIQFHFQSWFMCFNKRVLSSNCIAEFLCKIKPQKNFEDVVLNYELKFTTFLLNKGFKCKSFLPLEIDKLDHREQEIGNRNKMHFPYHLVNNLRFPFVKIKFFVDDSNAFYKDNRLEVLDLIKKNNIELYYLAVNYLTKKGYINKYLSIKTVKSLIMENDLISFDIFDTLLIRPYIKPTDLFLHIEEYYKIPGFAAARIKAEEQARLKYRQYEDITFNQIYNCIPSNYKKMKNKELIFEAQILKQHPKNYELYKFAVSLNKKIVLTSDMYLPSSFILKVLKKNGYYKIDKLFISSERKVAKYTGNLFKLVVDYSKSLKIEKKRILHIGDNTIADYEIPKKNGLNAFCITPYFTYFISQIGYQMFKNYMNQCPLTLARSVILASAAYYHSFIGKDYWYSIGYTLSGPFSVGYINNIIKIAHKNKINELIFVARDGMMLRKLYQLLDNNRINNHYIYAPRIMNFRCFGYEESFNTYLKIYIKMLNNIFSKIRIRETDKDILIEIKKNKDIISKWLKNNRKNYYSYLAKQEINGKNIACIDMTTSKFTSAIFFQNIFQQKFKMGFYSFTFLENKQINYNTYWPSVAPCDFCKIAILSELLVSSAEPPIIDVKKDGSPIYKKNNKYENTRIKCIQRINPGAVDFAKYWISTFGKYNIQIKAQEAFSLLDCFINCRTPIDDARLKKVYHAEDPLNTKYDSLYTFLTNTDYSVINKSDATFLYDPTYNVGEHLATKKKIYLHLKNIYHKFYFILKRLRLTNYFLHLFVNILRKLFKSKQPQICCFTYAFNNEKPPMLNHRSLNTIYVCFTNNKKMLNIKNDAWKFEKIPFNIRKYSIAMQKKLLKTLLLKYSRNFSKSIFVEPSININCDLNELYSKMPNNVPICFYKIPSKQKDAKPIRINDYYASSDGDNIAKIMIFQEISNDMQNLFRLWQDNIKAFPSINDSALLQYSIWKQSYCFTDATLTNSYINPLFASKKDI